MAWDSMSSPNIVLCTGLLVLTSGTVVSCYPVFLMLPLAGLLLLILEMSLVASHFTAYGVTFSYIVVK